MTKREVFQLLKLISVYYDPYEIHQEKVDEWFTVLKNDSFTRLREEFAEARGRLALCTESFRLDSKTRKQRTGHSEC